MANTAESGSLRACLGCPPSCPRPLPRAFSGARLRVSAAFQQDVDFSPNGAVKRRLSADSDPRLPAVGEEIAREYKGRSIVVRVLAGGFEYDGKIYKSLSAIAREVTGTKRNGYLFFGLRTGEGDGNEKR